MSIFTVSPENRNPDICFDALKALNIDNLIQTAFKKPVQKQKTTSTNSFKEAETLRKNGKYDLALPMFENLLENKPTADTLWRIAYCYRQMGENGFAMLMAGSGVREWPENEMIRSEFIWAYINAILKPQIAAKKHQDVIATAKKLILVGAEGLALRKIFFNAVDAAKALNRWDIVAVFAETVSVTNFPTVSPKHGKSNWSDAERYYMATLKALLNTQNYQKCREVALEAAAKFKTRFDFHRYAALALIEIGETKTALAELEVLRSTNKLPWYLLADIASAMLSCQQTDDALKTAVEALSMNGIPETKVNLFELTGEILLAQDNEERANLHFALAASLRNYKGWKISEKLMTRCALAGINHQAEWKPLFKQASQIWEQIKADAENNSPVFNGKINFVDPERNFGFIKPEAGGKVFFRPSESPSLDCVEGLEVTYKTRSSFDRAKQKESTSAFALTPREG